MRVKTPTLILGLVVVVSIPLPVFADANHDLQLGKKMFEHNHYRGAISAFDRAIRQNPRLDYAFGLRGDSYLQLEKHKEALADLNHAIAMNSTNWSYLEARARVKFELNDLDGAIADITKALQIHPRGDYLYRMRSKFYILQKKDDKALADLNKAIEFQDKDEEGTYRNRGDFYFRAKKYDLAVKDYTSAINASRRKKNDDDMEQQYSLRANAYEKLGKKDLAAADRKKVQSAVKDGWGAFLYEGNK